MKITVRESTMVTPVEKTPKKMLWISNLDFVASAFHLCSLFYYRPPNGTTNFFDAKVMKDSLSRALVSFYPIGGRLFEDENGRIMINCQGQGVLFVEAESDGVLDDLGDFAPTLEIVSLIPSVDYSLGIENYPLLLVQLTYFKCGGVSLGLGMHHYVADAASVMHFTKTWADIARGLDVILPPFMDRTLLRALDPPQPVFDHIEYQTTPIKASVVASSDEPMYSIFKLSREQLNVVKGKSKEKDSTRDYTSFELAMGHTWKCVCKARGLPDDQESRLYIVTDGRSRLQPALPTGYFGNVIIHASTIAVVGEIQSNPCRYIAGKIHDALVMRNNDYIKSTLDYLELQPDLTAVAKPVLEYITCTNLFVTSWLGLSVEDGDFGWGGPIYAGPGWMGFTGFVIVLPRIIKDGSLSIAISLPAEQMKIFSKLFYDIVIMNSSLPSKL